MLRVLEVKRESLARAFRGGYATATDLADYLVRKGVAFRDAHEIVGKSVRFAIESGRDLAELKLEELRRFSTAIADDVYALLTPEGSLAARDHFGGTAPTQVRAAVQRARQRLKQ
jgi:argininosuccinate lyase